MQIFQVDLDRKFIFGKTFLDELSTSQNKS